MRPNAIKPMEMEKPAKERMKAPEEETVHIKAHHSVSSGHSRQQGKSSVLRRAGGCISGSIHNFFYGLGSLVARRPWASILACVLVTVICGAGMMKFTTENRGEKLWVPSGTKAQEHKEYVEKFYGDSSSRIQIFQLTAPESGNVLTPEAFDAALSIHMKVSKVEAPDPKDTSSLVTWENYCLKRGDRCTSWSILAQFGYNNTLWQSENAILNAINGFFRPVAEAGDGQACKTTEGGFEITQLLGGIERDTESGNVTSAKLLSFGYLLQNNLELTDDNSETDPKGEAWEGAYLEVMKTAAETTKPWTVTYFSTRSFGDEFGAEVDADVNLLLVSIFLVISYTIINLSRWSEGCTGFRGLLCLGGILSIGMAIICSFGICSALGLFYSPLMSVLPFLLLGIGVDDMFVIVNSYDNTPAHLPVPERVALALAESGSSVTVTSLTDVLAFFIGSFTSLPALRNFSLYAAFAIMFDYIFQVTFFMGFLVFDSRRRAGKTADCICCCVDPTIACRSCASGPFDDSSQKYPEGQAPKGCCCNPGGFCATDDKMSKLLGAFASLVSKPVAKAAIILLFAGMAAAGAYGLSQIAVEGDVRNFIPPGSYLEQYIEVSDELLNEVGGSVAVYVKLEDVDLHNETLLQSMDELVQKIADNKWVSSCSVTDLPKFMMLAYNSTTGRAEFYKSLKEYTSSPGSRHANDVTFGGEGDATVVNLRLTASYVFLKNSREQVKAMDAIRETVEEHGQIGGGSFAYSDDFLQWEGYKSIGVEALRNIGLALLVVLIVIVALLVHPVGSVITFANVVLVVVEIIGFLHFWGLTIDNVSVIFIVISLGLSVDYSVHITHSFLHREGTGNERMVSALRDMGVAVANGVVSTWIAVIVLAGSGSYVFATFFKSLFLCTTLGMLHGLILLPVVLSILNPGTIHSTSTHDDEHEEHQKLAIP